MPRDYAGNRNRRRSTNQRSGSSRARGRKPSQNGKRPQNRKRSTAKAPTPGWVWMLCGLVIGALIATAGYIYTQPGSGTGQPGGQSPAAQAPHARNEKSATAGKSGLPPKVKPRFDFYKMLPNYQVVIPQKKNREKPEKTPSVSNPGSYVIQVGSFREFDAADALKARLALLGLETSIHKTELDSGETWYRVRIGPESDLDHINKALKRLSANDYDSLVVRIKG